MYSRSRHPGRQDFFDTCSHCRTSWSCCHETTPPITDERRKTIEDYLRTRKIVVDAPFVKEEYLFPRLDNDGYCVFHDKKTRQCIVHPVKPETCVAGPITFDINVTTGNIEWFLKKEKICALAGRIYEDKALLRKHVTSARKELSRLVKELDSLALRAILKKDEPETFKIDEGKTEKNVLKKLRSSTR